MRNQVYTALMKRRPQSTGGAFRMLGAWARTKRHFHFPNWRAVPRRGWDGGVRNSFNAMAYPHLNHILMTFPRLCPPLPFPKDSMRSSEPRYLQVQRILGQENGDCRLRNACRVSCIRLGSDDCKKMLGKSCWLPPSFVFLVHIQTHTTP